MPAPTPVLGAIGGPPITPGRLRATPTQESSGGVSGYKAVALTDGIYVAPSSNVMTDEPLWVNISERGTWAS